MTHPENISLVRFPDTSGRTLAQVLAECVPGTIIELSPGRYEGPLEIKKPVTLRGAGDLTRLSGEEAGSVVTVDIEDETPVVIESLLLEGGGGEVGGGLSIRTGRVRLYNVHIQRCRTLAGGGAIDLRAGELDATKLRAHDVSSDRGGAICARGDSVVSLRDSQISRTEARLGGAIAVHDQARVFVEGLTVGKSRATAPSGGQAFFISGAPDLAPSLELRRVRLEDAPLGMPIVVDPEYPGAVQVRACDMPRVVLDVKGVSDAGENHWR